MVHVIEPDESSCDIQNSQLQLRERSGYRMSIDMGIQEDETLRELDREIFTGKKKRRPSSASKKFIRDHVGMGDSEDIAVLLRTHEDNGVRFMDRTSRLANHSHMSECICLVSDTRVYILNSRLMPDSDIPPFLISTIEKISTSEERDNAIVIHLPKFRSELLMTPYKIELVAVLVKRFREITERELEVRFSNVVEFPVSVVSLFEVDFIPAAEGVRMTLFCKSAAGNPAT
jgi:hypothetical protein